MKPIHPDRLAVAVLVFAASALNVRAADQMSRATTRRPDSAPAAHSAVALSQSEMRIYGSVRNTANAPVPHVVLRLRNARTGVIVARTTSDGLGQFAFRVSEPGVYIPEVLDATGRVIAAGDMVTVDLGQSISTLIKLPTRIPLLGWFGDAAGAVASAAASAGVLAVAATAPAASAVK